MIKWDDAYSTGILILDEQHKKLFQYLNDLEGAIHEKDVGNELMLNVLNFFQYYINIHFGTEESCMHKHHCPVAQANQNAHRRFIEFFDGYKERLSAKAMNRQLLKELLKFSEDWIVEHICKIDVQLKPCVETASD